MSTSPAIEPIKKTKEKQLASRQSAYDEKSFKALTQKSVTDESATKPNLSPEKLSQAQFLSIINVSQASSAPLHLVFCDLSGVNMIGVNFKKADLRTSILKGSRLVKFCFDKATLAGADLSGCYLADCSFKGASLFKCNLSGAILTRASLVEANLVQADLSGADLTSADVSLAKFAGANLSKVTGFTQDQFRSVRTWKAINDNEEKRIVFAGCIFSDFDFTGWNLQNVTFSTAKLTGCRLMGADVKGSNFSYAQLDTRELAFVKNLNFEGCDLTGLTLSHLRLNNANFRNANLTLTNFNHSELARVIMDNAKLSQTNFFATILDPANLMRVRKGEDGRRCFVGCNLTAQRFTGLDLSRCDFTGAVLHAALLDRVVMMDSVLFGADLHDASMQGAQCRNTLFDRANMNGVTTDASTVFSKCSVQETILPPTISSRTTVILA